jgi:flavin-dependent dehydrogenase
MSGYDVIVIGGGPAGCSAAITLAQRGARILLLEEKRMPREKLCGEFVTAECLPLLAGLGVSEQLKAAGAQTINRLKLVVERERLVEARIDQISVAGSSAIGISRARFDQILFERACSVGTECREGIAVKDRLWEDGRVAGVKAVSVPEGRALQFRAPFIVDASGRNSRLMVGRRERVGGRRGSRMYAMKAHLRGVQGIDDQIELYFFRGGYGGLSRVEGGLVNLCFVLEESTLKRSGGNADRVLDETMRLNEVAAARLKEARPEGKWLTVGPLTFGRVRTGFDGVIAVGDASGMIDPFTGTGIQMALRTGELAGRALVESGPPEEAVARYTRLHRTEFRDRLKAAALLRRVAFSPAAARLAASVMTRFPGLGRRVIRATRKSGGRD